MKMNAALLVTILGGLLLLQNCITSQADPAVDYPITPVDFTHVKLQEGFWKDWVRTVRDATIPYSFNKCEETGRIDNFIYAAGIKEGQFRGRFGFNDSDLLGGVNMLEGEGLKLIPYYAWANRGEGKMHVWFK